MEDLQNVFASINDVLSNVTLDEVTSESNGFSNEELPDGYYLSEVEKAEIKTSKTSGKPMVAFQFKVVENGIAADVDEQGRTVKSYIEKTQNRKIFLNYVLSDEKSVKRFASDMLKFEGDEPGESLLPKEAFISAETLYDALEVLEGMRIFIQVSTSKNREGKDMTWKNPISWKRVDALELR